ncbi:MAG: AMP-binding protein [Desulfobacterales bacterium]
MQIQTPLNKLMTRPWFKHYPKAVRDAIPTYNLPKVPLYRFLESASEYFPDTCAVVYEPENVIISYRDLMVLSQRFASGLVHICRVKKGDSVAICARNYPEFIIAFYGILLAGARYVACNPLLVEEETAYQLQDADCRVVVISEDKIPEMVKIHDAYPAVCRRIIVFDRDRELKPGILQDALPRLDPPFYRFVNVLLDKPFERPHIDPAMDTAAVMYTSGTTGEAKGVMISHFNAVSSSICYYTTYTECFPEMDANGFLKCENFQRDLSGKWEFPMRYGVDSTLAVSPWTHMMGFIPYLNCSVMAGITVFPMPVFDMEKALNLIRRWKISFAGGAPQMMAMLLARPDTEQIDLSSIRVWATGSAPCPVAVGRKFEKRIGGVVSEGYSLTEATVSSTKNYAGRSCKRKWGSVGIPLPFTDIKIVDLDTGSTLMPVGEEGQLIQKGPQVAVGYLNKPEETAEVFKDGWLYTGDVAKMDEDGYVYITGRLKEIIIYKGYNIAPRMLEEILYQHPGVLQCAVVGKKDDLAGEIPVAFVSLKEGDETSAGELTNFVNERVAGYKKIREMHIVDSLPMTGFGKILHQNLKRQLEQNARYGE